MNAAGNGAAATASAYGTTITSKASATTVSSGKTFTVTGKVTDSESGNPVAGQSVTLFARATGNTSYASLGIKATTAADGTYSFPVLASQTKWYYVSTTGQDRMAGSGTHFAVHAVATATIALDHSVIAKGHKVTFSGKVAPKAAKVELQRKVGSTWTTVRTITTATGTYSFAWTPGSTTDYAWRVRVSGSTFDTGVSATKVLTVS